ncbi:MAG: DUF4340 domain-containing protein [Oscillospiraceae bacterium]
MNRSKRLFILLGVLAVVCLATLAVTQLEEHKEKVKNSGETILAVDSDAVESLSWDYEGTAFAFHRDGEAGTWLYDEDEAFPVDAEKLGKLLEGFRDFAAAFIIEEVEDYGQYGLDDPLCTIRLSTAEEEYVIELGSFSSMDSQRYVSVGDGNVYLVKEDPLDTFDVALSDLIDHDETPDFGQAEEIRFSGAESYSILLDTEGGKSLCADDVYFAQLDGRGLPLDTDRVEGYLDDIHSLDLTDYVTYNATEEELRDCGLDSPELTVTVRYPAEQEDGEETTETFVLYISPNAEEKAAAEESGATEEQEVTAYVRVGDSRIIYRITADEYEDLAAASYDSLRHREVLTADFADVTQLDITLEGKAYTITSQEEDGERTYYYREKELDIDSLQDALEDLSASSFTDEMPEKKSEIGLTVHLDNENFPEVRIELYRYDGDYCLAVVDGESVALVARAKVVDLIEAVNGIVLR